MSETLGNMEKLGEWVEYSTEERVVGKWIDSKPIYQKTLTAAHINQGVTVISHGISNFETLISLDLIWYDTTDGRWYTRTRYNYNNGSIYSISAEGTGIDGTKVYLQTGSNFIDWSARTSNVYVTVRYTKSTN